MFLFDGLAMLAIMLFLYGIPALVIALLWFKDLNIIERFLLGFFTTFLAFGALHSIIGYLLGQVSYLTIGLSWVLIILAAWLLSDKKIDFSIPQDKRELMALAGLIIVLLFTYMIRISSFSPIYLEFDPYFYLEGVKMLLNHGVIPMHDDTAWYPYIEKSSHRSPPLIHYTLAAWYYLYPHTTVDRYLLSAIANFYPPLAAVGMAFMFYLLGYALTKNRLVGLGLAVFAAYTPVFIYKLMSGVFEYQPYNFFVFSYVVAALALFVSTKKPDYYWALLLGIFATMIGAIASPAIMVYLAIALAFYAWKEGKPLWGVFLATLAGGLWLWFYLGSTSKLKYALMMLAVPALPYLKQWIEKQGKKAIGLLVGVGILAAIVGYAFFGSMIHSALVAAQYNNPLERTIQEQTLAGPSLSMVGVLGTPADKLIASQNPIIAIVGWIYYIISIPGVILNWVISGAINLLQAFGLNTSWIPKEPSAAYGLFALGMALLLWDLWKKDFNEGFLIAAGSVILLIGLIKAKFQIYFVFGFLLMLAYLIYKAWKFLQFKEKEIVFLTALLIFSGYGFLANLNLSLASFVPTYGNDPMEMQNFFQQLCSMDARFCNLEDVPITLQYNPQLCQYYLYQKYGGGELDVGKQLRIQLACNYMPAVWHDPMEWLYNSTPNDSRVISWWDYGHWINYWGERKAVIRNEHSVLQMILDTAYAFVMGNETTLAQTMEKYDAQYALIDQEIVIGSEELFGGKFFALNYLACAGANQTSVRYQPMDSVCEWENLWEVVQLTDRTCDINGIRQGYVALKRTFRGTNGNITPYYEEAYCFTPNDGSLNISRLKNNFAISLLVELQPNVLYVAYKLNETDPAKKLQKALWIPLKNNAFVALYLEDPIWFVDGQWVGGYEDRTTRFYDSVLYRGFVLEDLQGFTQTYNNGYVKIYLRENMGQG